MWSAFRKLEKGSWRFRLGVAGVEEPAERMEVKAAIKVVKGIKVEKVIKVVKVVEQWGDRQGKKGIWAEKEVTGVRQGTGEKAKEGEG